MTQVLTKEEEEIEVLPLGNNEPYILPAAKGVEAYRNENLVCKHLYRRKATTNIPVTVCFCEDARPEKELGRIVLSEGEYRDVVGLCKVATIGKVYDDKGKFVGYEDDSIGDQDFSLNPGRYVGVVIEDDGLTQDEFKQRMMAYYTALSKLNKEAHGLENKVMDNIQKLLG